MYSIVIQLYIYMYLFSNSFPILVIMEYWVEFSVLHSRSLWVIYVKYSNVWLSWWLSGKESACQCKRLVIDPWSMCLGANEPMCQNYWASALESRSHDHWVHMTQLLKSAHPRPWAPPQKKPLPEALRAHASVICLQHPSLPPHSAAEQVSLNKIKKKFF